MAERIIRGLGCPACGGSLAIEEGTVVVLCQFCSSSLLVVGDRGIARYYVPLKHSNEAIKSKVQSWFRGINKASDLKREAKFSETFPVYIPFWRINALAVGWVLGDVEKGSGDSKRYEPVERRVCNRYEMTLPACDIGEFGVKWVDLKGDEILPFELEKVQKLGMTFQVLTTPTDLIEIARDSFLKQAETSAGVKRTTFSRIHLLNQKCSVVFYPLWIVRYQYKNRIYQVTADGESSELLYGRAPGNNLYRVFCLIASIVVADFVLSSSCRSSFSNSSKDDDLFGLFVVCILVMLFGFWRFRYGGEVKIEQKDQMDRGVFAKFFPEAKSQIGQVVSLFKKV